MKLVIEPFIPFALWLALALLAVAVMVWYALTNKMSASRGQRILILTLMSLTVALPLLVLLNPTWIQNVPPPAGKPVVRVLVDTSSSMATDDVDGQTRLWRAQQITKEATETLSDQFDVRVSLFDTKLKSSDMGDLENQIAEASETNLATAIGEAIKEDIPQGQSILLLSDGIHNATLVSDVIENAGKAEAMAVPVFTSTVGGKVGVKNLAISLRSPQELAFVGQVVPAVVNVNAIGVANRPIGVELWKDGEQIEKSEITVGEGVAETTFSVSQTEPGLYRYEVRVVPIEDEATVADNRSTLLLRVVDRPIKMLLIEGKPYWDTKFLVRRLSADQSIELTSVIRLAENRYLERTLEKSAMSEKVSGDGGSMEKGVEKERIVNDVDQVISTDSLSGVQIVVLGRSAEYFLSDDSLEALRNWISRDGGSLVCARGAPSARISQRLGQILPVRWSMGRESRFRVSMTTQGRDLRWLASFGDTDVLGAMPSLATVATAEQRQGLSNVLAATVDSDDGQVVPVLSYQPYGSGRTVVVEGAGMWRWALMSPQYSEQEEVYATLWRSLLRWLVSRAGLMPGQNISLQPDRVSFDTNDVSTATMLVRTEKIPEVPRVVVRSSDNAEPKFEQEFVAQPVGQEPGIYRLNFGKLPAGQYSAEPIMKSADAASDEMGQSVKSAFDVRERWVERLELDARPDLMSRIADASGGAVLETADPQEFAEQFEEHLTRARPPKFRRVAMWDRWWIMGAILTMWAATWIVRRRSGLI